jgi:hypothetical protein
MISLVPPVRVKRKLAGTEQDERFSRCPLAEIKYIALENSSPFMFISGKSFLSLPNSDPLMYCPEPVAVANMNDRCLNEIRLVA